MLFSHDAPFLTITDRAILEKFLACHNIDCSVDKTLLMHNIADAFSKIPYENLTKILKSDGVINVRSAMRYPDELIGDYLRWGTGGTCFSLTAAIIAVYNACGIEAHPVLADRHYGVDTHCGLILVTAAGVHLLDPGYLLFIPTLLPSLSKSSVNTGYNTIELVPLPGGEKLELYTVVKGNRKLRLVYKTAPVSAERFEKAWETSFKWEMMTYPVLTRVSAGQHQYIQGNKLAIRTDEKTHRMELTTENEVDYIANNLGINREIVKKAFGVINNGRH
jgi:arylamine N-acetyltransferase